jgi:hypothetical protein
MQNKDLAAKDGSHAQMWLNSPSVQKTMIANKLSVQGFGGTPCGPASIPRDIQLHLAALAENTGLPSGSFAQAHCILFEMVPKCVVSCHRTG